MQRNFLVGLSLFVIGFLVYDYLMLRSEVKTLSAEAQNVVLYVPSGEVMAFSYRDEGVLDQKFALGSGVHTIPKGALYKANHVVKYNTDDWISAIASVDVGTGKNRRNLGFRVEYLPTEANLDYFACHENFGNPRELNSKFNEDLANIVRSVYSAEIGGEIGAEKFDESNFARKIERAWNERHLIPCIRNVRVFAGVSSR